MYHINKHCHIIVVISRVSGHRYLVEVCICSRQCVNLQRFVENVSYSCKHYKIVHIGAHKTRFSSWCNSMLLIEMPSRSEIYMN